MKNLRLFSKEQEYQAALQTWGGGQYVTYTEDTNKVFYNPQQEVPFAYKQIKGIENRSNAYIDTGYRENNMSEFDIKLDYLQNLKGGLYESAINDVILQDKKINIYYVTQIQYINIKGEVPDNEIYDWGNNIPYFISKNMDQNIKGLNINTINSIQNNGYIDYKNKIFTIQIPIIKPCIGSENLPYSFQRCEEPISKDIDTTLLKVKDSYLKTKLYEVTIKESDKVKVHLLPVKRIYDGKIGMYDTINNKFLTSPNGTEFIGIE